MQNSTEPLAGDAVSPPPFPPAASGRGGLLGPPAAVLRKGGHSPKANKTTNKQKQKRQQNETHKATTSPEKTKQRNFCKVVMLVISHTDQFTAAVVLNRPTSLTTETIL